jgi:ribosome maturation factor RimP
MNWHAAVELTVTGLGYELVDCERAGRGLLTVFIDQPEGAAAEFITVDDCEKVTRQLQRVLEVEGVAYERLEVSSPGLDRPLKKARDYERFAGEQVELQLKMPFNGRRKFSGRLEGRLPPAEGAAEAAPVLYRLVFSDGKSDQALDFSLDEVRDARLVPVVDFKGRRFAPPEPSMPDTAPSVPAQAAEGAGAAADPHGGKNQ